MEAAQGIHAAIQVAQVVGPAIPDHQQRVLDEKRCLDGRLHALTEFVSTNPVFKALQPDERWMLREQASAMRRYADILAMRIRRWGLQP